MPWGAVAGAVIGAYASDKAGDKARGAGDSAINEQRRQYDQSRKDQLPWLNAGSGALEQMQQLNSGNFSSFKQSPDYQFAYDQGMQALDRSAASRGGLYGGGHSADLMKFGQGLASQNYGQYYNRLASMAGLGQTASQGLGQLGAQSANSIGNLYNSRASSYLDQGQNYSNLAGVGASAFGDWYGNNKANNPGGTGWYFGNNPGKG